MLGMLGEYLFGAADNAAADETQASPQVEFDTREEEQGWTLVDVPGKGDGSKITTSQGEGRMPPRQIARRWHHQQQLRRHRVDEDTCGLVRDSSSRADVESESPSDCESQGSSQDFVVWAENREQAGRPLGESWIVTPPPCFTGTDSSINAGQRLATSPLENLLIEHPHWADYRSLMDAPKCAEGLAELEQQATYHWQQREDSSSGSWARENLPPTPHPESDYELADRPADQPVAQPTARPVRPCAGLAQQIKLTRCHLRKQQLENSWLLSRKNFERNNKARMVQSSSRKSVSARNRVLRPSGCMNSRRTQRNH